MVVKIRALVATGSKSHREIAREFGVSRSLIGQIIHGIIWKHIL